MTVGCGCELAIKAKTDPDATARAVWEAQYRELQRRWRCPGAGYSPAASVDDLDAECRTVVDGVARITGDEVPPTCPMHCARVAWVHRIADALEDAKGSAFNQSEPRAPFVLIEAMHTLRRAREKRRARELEREKQKLERDQQNHDE